MFLRVCVWIWLGYILVYTVFPLVGEGAFAVWKARASSV